MSLLDTNIKYYFVEKKGKKLDSTDIFDENGSDIGKIKKDEESKEISVLEPTGELIFRLRKTRSFPAKYEMYETDDKPVARFKIKKEEVLMEIVKPATILKAEGEFFHFGISENKEKVLAHASELNRVFLQPKLTMDLTKAHVLAIEDSFERKFLICFFVFLLNNITEKFGRDWRDTSAPI